MSINKASSDIKSTAVRPRFILSKLWTFLNSLKLTIFVLIALAALSILGTVIQQNQPLGFYFSEYGERWANTILLLGANDLYHAAWFQGLIILLTVNLIVCTIERFPAKWKATLEIKTSISPRFVTNLSNSESFYIEDGVEGVKNRVLDILKKKRYKVKEISSGEDVALYASKGKVGRFGSDVVHVALLLIFLGALISSIWGYRDFTVLYVGDAVKVPKTDFQLKLNKFWVDYYDTGQVKQYNSILTVIDGGKEVVKDKHIWVNEPLHYKGITFYQSSYGVAWDRIGEAELLLKEGDRNVGKPFNVKWQEKVLIPDSGYSVRMVAFVSDFGYDPDAKAVFSKSGEHNNPAVQVEVYDGEALVARPWLFLNYPNLFSTIPGPEPGSEYNLHFTAYRGVQYSGLSINKDPGANIVWIGSSLMLVGFLMAFFIFHKRLWIVIRGGGNPVELALGGTVNKNRILFAREFKDIVGLLRGSSTTKEAR